MIDRSHPNPDAVVAHAPIIGRDGLCIACRSPLMTGWHVPEPDEVAELHQMAADSCGAIQGELLALHVILQRLQILEAAG